MDRFIENCLAVLVIAHTHLKSNMDRFIARSVFSASALALYLKSNMDRFIVQPPPLVKVVRFLFKIQYG